MERVTKPLRVPELVGATEIAEIARVATGTVKTWTIRHADFPKPVVTLATGRVWLRADIEKWLEKDRPTGRPRKVSVSE